MRVAIGELLTGRRAAQRLAFYERLAPPAEDTALLQPVEGELVLTKAGRTVALTGRLRTALSLVCGACLARFEQSLEFALEEEFGPFAASAGGPGPVELQPPDFVIPVGANETIDLTEIIRQHLILALPISPRCREGCPGLCPACGADLTAGPCVCGPDEGQMGRLSEVGRFFERWPAARRG